MRGIIQVSGSENQLLQLCIYIFFTSFASSFICNANSLLKKKNRVDRWTDKKQSILCFFWEFYWGQPQCHTDEETEWQFSSPTPNFTHLFLSLHAGRRSGVRWMKTKTVSHGAAQSGSAGIQYLQPTAMQQQQVCVSVWERDKETKGGIGKAETHNGIHKKWGKDRKRGTKAGLEMHFTQPGSLLDGACRV